MNKVARLGKKATTGLLLAAIGNWLWHLACYILGYFCITGFHRDTHRTEILGYFLPALGNISSNNLATLVMSED